MNRHIKRVTKMQLSYLIGLWAFLPFTLLTTPSAPLLAQKNRAEQTKKELPAAPQENTSHTLYQNCRLEVLRFAKDNPNDKNLRQKLELCKSKWPEAHAFHQCKAKAIQDHRKDPEQARISIRNCREEWQNPLAFNAQKDRIPLQRAGKDLGFAGVKFNQTLSVKNLKKQWPHFDCQRVTDTLAGKIQPEYTLFGNPLHAFTSPWPKNSVDNMQKRLKKTDWQKVDDKESFQDIGNKLRIFKRKNFEDALFLPTSYCSYAGETGKFYESLKLYVLVDFAAKEITPYFGLIFYNTDALADAEGLIKGVKDRLGPAFREFATQKDARYLVESEISAFDYEDDPFGVCLLPRTHRLIAAIKQRKPQDKSSMLMVIANVENLCHFGDHKLRQWLTDQEAQSPRKKRKK